MSADERTGWRDEELSRRHREWGENLPAADLDFLLMEYDRAKVVALIEYKRWPSRPVETIWNPTLKALGWLADGRRIPAILVWYRPSPTWEFRTVPLNAIASDMVGRKTMTEAQYVAELHRLRGRPVPAKWREAAIRDGNCPETAYRKDKAFPC